jgi:streptogramin lyase
MQIVSGPDGTFWFAASTSSPQNPPPIEIGRITTQGKIIARFPVPMKVNGLGGMTSGPDGALWFIENIDNKIGRITTGGHITEFPFGSSEASYLNLEKITAGPDGALWFTGRDSGPGCKIGRITTQEKVTFFRVQPCLRLEDLVVGPDGALWFPMAMKRSEQDPTPMEIGRITMQGKITTFAVPTTSNAIEGIAAGPDGALWFTEDFANRIGRITTQGKISEFTLPTPQSRPSAIAAGPDGSLWFSEIFARDGNPKIGRISTEGKISEFTIPSPDAPLLGTRIVVGPDKALWFITSSHIMRINSPH